MNPSTDLPSTDPLEARLASLWESTRGNPSARLLRIALLRDYVLGLHVLASNLLVAGAREATRALGVRQKQVEHEFLRLPLESLGFLEFLRSLPPYENAPEANAMGFALNLPEPLAAFLDPRKLLRPDRHWERTLAIEAFASGWSFWQIEASIDFRQLEPWARQLSSALWPSGLPLYAENAENSDGTPHPGVSADQTSWRGRWLLVLSPEVGNLSPDKPSLHLPVSKWQVSPGPGEMEWRRVLPGQKAEAPCR